MNQKIITRKSVNRAYNIPLSFDDFEPHIIYKITNIKTKRQYVGLSKQELSVRWGQHISGSGGVYIGRSIKKYGKAAFDIEVVDLCDSRKQANKLETHYIKRLNTLAPNGYNLTTGGDGVSGVKQSTEHINKRMTNAKETRIRNMGVKRALRIVVPLDVREKDIDDIQKHINKCRRSRDFIAKARSDRVKISHLLDANESRWSRILLRVDKFKHMTTVEHPDITNIRESARVLLEMWYKVIEIDERSESAYYIFNSIERLVGKRRRAIRVLNKDRPFYT